MSIPSFFLITSSPNSSIALEGLLAMQEENRIKDKMINSFILLVLELVVQLEKELEVEVPDQSHL